MDCFSFRDKSLPLLPTTGHEFERALEVGNVQGSLACCSPWGHTELDTTELNWTDSTVSGLPRWLSGKESACSAGDPGLIPGSRRSPGGGHGNPLQYSCLENPMDRGAWRATVHGIAKSQTRLKPLSTHTHTLYSSGKAALSIKPLLPEPLSWTSVVLPAQSSNHRIYFSRRCVFPPL